ncbi:NAD(P)/FAD-dependent oxidoreductase [uncultured Ezakiella sp.]|uniref:NAD(P)/FAD-dependent oxidoreductase n=1 Tax=uncultured Ezakiella sp. TaxID=1637529 RepID=UPI0034590F53
MIYDLIVIGAGASGLFVASMVNQNQKVLIIEKNDRPGKKLKITGKGRCNITNSKPINEFFEEVFTNNKFLFSSFYEFTNYDLLDFLNQKGLNTKTERGGRVFPFTDKSTDVIDSLYCNSKAEFLFNENVLNVSKDNIFTVETDNGKYNSRFLLIATGGLSYPMTGSTGDGYNFAKSFGHTIIPTRPALVGLNVDLSDEKELMGLSLRNVNVSLISNKKHISEFGELLFTHYGISGPTILTLSSFAEKGDIVSIDLKPGLDYTKLDNRLLRDFNDNINKSFKNSLDKLFPKSMINYIVKRSGIDEDKKVNQITIDERKSLINLIKNLEFKVISRRGFNEAVITDGGINVKEINPKTMESNLIPGLYFAGEIIDVAANTGGYNLQIAFSTAYKAFKSISEEL